MKLLWDTEQTQTTLDLAGKTYRVTITTGTTQGVENKMTALRLRAPDYAAFIQRDVLDRIGSAYAGMIRAGSIAFNVPEFLLLSYTTPAGVVPLAAVWGLMLTGSGREKQPPVQFRFILCLEHEIAHEDDDDDVLSKVFELERILTPNEPTTATPPARRRSA